MRHIAFVPLEAKHLTLRHQWFQMPHVNARYAKNRMNHLGVLAVILRKPNSQAIRFFLGNGFNEYNNTPSTSDDDILIHIIGGAGK